MCAILLTTFTCPLGIYGCVDISVVYIEYMYINEYEKKSLINHYDRCIETKKDKDFFIALFDYVEFIENTSSVSKIALAIINKGNTEREILKKHEDEVVSELVKVRNELSYIIKKEGIENSINIKDFDFFDQLIEGTARTQDKVKYLYNCLIYVIEEFISQGLVNKVLKYIVFKENTNNKNIKRYDISGKYDQYISCRKDVILKSEIDLWGNLDEVLHIIRYLKIDLDYVYKNNIDGFLYKFDEMSIKNEWNNLDNVQNKITFKRERLQTCLERLHLHILDKIEMYTVIKKEKDVVEYSFNKKESCLYLCFKEKRLSFKNFRGNFVNELIMGKFKKNKSKTPSEYSRAKEAINKRFTKNFDFQTDFIISNNGYKIDEKFELTPKT